MLKETVLLVLFLNIVVHALPIDDGIETKSVVGAALPLQHEHEHEHEHDMMDTAETKSYGGGGKGGGKIYISKGGGYGGSYGGGGKGCGCKKGKK